MPPAGVGTTAALDEGVGPLDAECLNERYTSRSKWELALRDGAFKSRKVTRPKICAMKPSLSHAYPS